MIEGGRDDGRERRKNYCELFIRETDLEGEGEGE